MLEVYENYNTKLNTRGIVFCSLVCSLTQVGSEHSKQLIFLFAHMAYCSFVRNMHACRVYIHHVHCDSHDIATRTTII